MAIGIFMDGGDGTRLVDNTISVGSHDTSVQGMILGGETRRLVVTGNAIEVARSDLGIQARQSPVAVAVSLGGDDSLLPDEPSLFLRNVVGAGSAVIDSKALSLGTVGWVVTGNFIHGGFGRYTMGAQFYGLSPTDLYPAIIHNTFHGGGDPALTLRSKAIEFGVSGDSGVFINNLIDPGRASGRRFGFHNRWGPVPRLVEGNYAQFETQSVDANPGFLYAQNRDPTPQFYASLMAGSGEMVSGRTLPTFWEEGAEAILGQVLDDDADGKPDVWMGGVSGSSDVWIAALTDRGIASGIFGQSDSFRTVEAKDSAERPRQPSDIVITEMNDEYPYDILFIETVAGPAPGVWLMAGSDNGYELATKLFSTLAITEPTLLRGGPTDALYITNGSGSSQEIYTLDRSPMDPAPMTLPFAESILDLVVTNFGFTALASTDFVFVTSSALRVYLDVSGTIPAEASFDTVPCTTSSASSATNVAVGDLGDPVGFLELAVACADGTIEAFYYNDVGTCTGPDPCFAILASGGNTDPIVAIAASVNDLSNIVTISDTGSTGLEHRVHGISAGTISAVASTPILSDIGMMGSAGEFIPDFALLPGIIFNAGSICELKLHVDPLAPSDLHLTNTPNACNNGTISIDFDFIADTIESGLGVATLPPAILTDLDYDRDGDQRAITPDVGADEVQ